MIFYKLNAMTTPLMVLIRRFKQPGGLLVLLFIYVFQSDQGGLVVWNITRSMENNRRDQQTSVGWSCLISEAESFLIYKVALADCV